MTLPTQLEKISNCLARTPGLEFAVLVGSRAQGKAGPDSDWDIALFWKPEGDWYQQLAEQEHLRQRLAEALQVSPEAIDLIDLPRANLAMRASAAEEGVLLTGEDSLAWPRFLVRTWRELEDFYWERAHAA